MLDLLKLETFRMVANTGSFTRAGAELGYSQSSVSAHIDALEREVGGLLLVRSRSSKEIALTELGRRTLEYAGRLLTLAQEAATAIQAQAEPSGQVRVAAHPLLLAWRVASVLGRYQARYPQVRLRLSSWADPRILHTGVMDGVTDLAFTIGEPVASERLAAASLGMEKLLVVCSPRHRLARMVEGIRLEELAQNQILWSDPICSVRMAFESALDVARVRMDNTVEAGGAEAVKRCAIAGLGFAVLPAFDVESEIHAGELIAIPVSDADLTVEIQMIRNSQHWFSPAANALWTMALPTPAMISAA